MTNDKTSSPLQLRLPSPLEPLDDNRLSRHGVRLLLKRDDLINVDIPGNKWRKLKYNLADAAASGKHTLLTFGGAYSNHIRAVAAAGHYFGFETIGVIRGEEHLPLNPALDYAVRHGMTLDYLDRTTYRDKASPGVEESLMQRFGDFFLIPEGGSNAAAVRVLPRSGPSSRRTTTSSAVLVGPEEPWPGSPSASHRARALGFAALKGAGFLVEDLTRLQREYGRVTDNWTIELGYHFGGFGRRSSLLDEFIADFRQRHSIDFRMGLRRQDAVWNL